MFNILNQYVYMYEYIGLSYCYIFYTDRYAAMLWNHCFWCAEAWNSSLVSILCSG